MIRLTTLVAALWLVCPVAAPAQSTSLDRADSLIAAAAYGEARSVVDGWWTGREVGSAAGAERARALMLRARLAEDPGDAEADYLAVVLGYPTSPQAPEALLRLGQGLLVAGESARAAAYLQRLVLDYPGRAERTLGLLWLARASYAARQVDDACQAARSGLRDSRDPDMTALFRVEEAGSCSTAGVPGQPVVARSAADGEPPAAAQRQALSRPPVTTRADTVTQAGAVTEAPAGLTGRFAVQAGAFRYREGVDELVARLRRAGYQPRVALVPGSELMRVRVGRFEAGAEATRLVARLKADGFDAVAVGDADREREP